MWIHKAMHSLLCPELGVLEALSGSFTLNRKCRQPENWSLPTVRV